MQKETAFYENYKVEKLKCFIHYFNQQSILEDTKQYITIERISFKKKYHIEQYFTTNQTKLNATAWVQSNCPLISQIQLIEKGCMFEQQNSIIVDFANKYIGGGVLSHGMVQEEILFTINPEALVSVFITSCLQDEEALMIDGIRQFSDYTGYRDKFKFVPSPIQDKKQTFLVNIMYFKIFKAIDAINFSKRVEYVQWSEENILRELNKAFLGFCLSENCSESMFKKTVCTGRWGCGAFKGDSRLKFLLQWIAFSQSRYQTKSNRFFNVQLIFYAFGDPLLSNLPQLITELSLTYQNVGQLAQKILEYGRNQTEQTQNIFDYLRQKL